MNENTNRSILGKLCVKTSAAGMVVTEVGVVSKVASRTIHVDWGKKTWVYQNKDFRFLPMTPGEFATKYKKYKLADEVKARAAVLGIEV